MQQQWQQHSHCNKLNNNMFPRQQTNRKCNNTKKIMKLQKYKVKILNLIQPGKEETGCLTCFYAPPHYPAIISHITPCIDYPEYILREVRASQYIYIRENSIEYNSPSIQPARSNNFTQDILCCGNSSTDLVVLDHISVIYYDDILMDEVRNDTRICNPMQTFCCGGYGEEVRLESTFCGGLCYRVRGGGSVGCCRPCCVPVGCPDCLCPCAARVSLK
jgi:hypothetical protein